MKMMPDTSKSLGSINDQKKYILDLPEIAQIKQLARKLESRGIRLDLDASYFHQDEVGSSGVDNLNIYQFSRKGQYIVEMHDPQFSKLNGSYASIAEIKNKIILLAFEDNGIINYKKVKIPGWDDNQQYEDFLWQCPKCHKCGSHDKQLDEIDNIVGCNTYNLSMCQSCYFYIQSTFNSIEPNFESGCMYKHSGGTSIILLDKVGKLIFIPDKVE